MYDGKMEMDIHWLISYKGCLPVILVSEGLAFPSAKFIRLPTFLEIMGAI